jgi:hypothetical protein
MAAIMWHYNDVLMLSMPLGESQDSLAGRFFHQSPGYFDHVLEVIVIIFKTYFEKDQNILTSSSSMGFLAIKLMIIIISTFSLFFIFFSTIV